MSERDREAASEDRRMAVRSLSDSPGPNAAMQVAIGLRDADWRVRKEAAATAGRLAHDPAVIQVLCEALLQPDDVSSRNAAIEAFAHIGPRGAPALLDALSRSTVTARKFICAALGGTGLEGVPALAELARDPDPNTATVALESLARVGGPAAEEALRRQLSAEDWVVRLAALEGLAQLGARVPVKMLSGMIDDPLLRRFAIRLLGRSDDVGACGPLLRCFGRPSSRTELAEIAVALSSVAERAPGAVDAITDACLHASATTRAALREVLSGDDLMAARSAAHLLALAKDEPSLGDLATLAARSELSPGAVTALRGFGASAVRPLLRAEADLDPPARAWALEVAAELSAFANAGEGDAELGREVRHSLRAALGTRDSVVVRAATRALSYWAEPQDASTLVQLGDAHRGEVAREAGTALEALSQTAPKSVELALDLATPESAEGWSAAVAALDSDAALEKLGAAISSGDANARRAAVQALARIDSGEAAEIAAVALADEDVDVRLAAVGVLPKFRAIDAREVATRTLRLALREHAAPVRAAAARSLGMLGDRESVVYMRELLRDSGPGVALAALEAIRVLQGGELAEGSSVEDEQMIMDVLAHPDEEVVKEGLRLVADSELPDKEARLAYGLTHAKWDVRRLSASLLGLVGTEHARTSLRERAAVETDDLVLSTIADALGAMGD